MHEVPDCVLGWVKIFAPSLLEPFTEDHTAGSEGPWLGAFESCGPLPEILSISQITPGRQAY